MIHRTLVLQAAATALLTFATLEPTTAFNVNVINKCEKTIDLAQVDPSGVKMQSLAPGSTTTRTFAPGSGSHVLKAGAGAQATLAEFSGEGGKAWYDISIIPTGPKSGPEYCPNIDACKKLTGGVGFNEPMQIAPTSPDGRRCVTLTCLTDGCADGYQFPKDDTKTHVCPLTTDFDLTFCPGGQGGATPAPTPPPTTQAPTPPPTTQAPVTVSPTPVPSPSSTKKATEDRSIDDTVASNSSSRSDDAGVKSDKTNKPTLLVNDPESEVARDADTPPTTAAPVTTAPSTSNNNGVTAAGALTTTPPTTTNEISVQATESNGSGASATLYVAGILCAVAMIAGTAIVAVRRKKAQLDAIESKTPRPTTTVAGGGACIMITPNNNNVSVL